MTGIRDNGPMRQLQLFTTAELSRMRDRTASRTYSPERDEFRRVHEHHRAWGLIQRHRQRLRHLRNTSRAPQPATMPDYRRQDHLPSPAPTQAPALASAPAPAPALAPAPARPGQRQHATPAVDQRRCPARSQPARSRHRSASQQSAPCHQTPTSAVELTRRAGRGPPLRARRGRCSRRVSAPGHARSEQTRTGVVTTGATARIRPPRCHQQARTATTTTPFAGPDMAGSRHDRGRFETTDPPSGQVATAIRSSTRTAGFRDRGLVPVAHRSRGFETFTFGGLPLSQRQLIAPWSAVLP